MRMIVKSVDLKHFKGVEAKHIDFTDKTFICGQNGSGKTSVVTAWLWLWCDRDYDLNSNPEVRNDNADDSEIPTVTASIEIDGKPLTVCKKQKFKRSKPDDEGITKTSTTNSYEINAVEYSARDFEKRLSEDFGVDFEKILQLSHANVFISGMKDKKSRDEMRKTLFDMTEGVTDKSIADSDDRLMDVAKLLENYRLDEIEAMQKASMRKINEQYGKDGEIIDAEIRGLSGAKTVVDIDDLEQKKNDLSSQIADIDEQINSGVVDTSDIQGKINSIKQRIQERMWNINSEYKQEKNRLDNDILRQKQEKSTLESKLSYVQDMQNACESKKKDLEEEIADIKEQYLRAKAREFDPVDGKCEYCGQDLPEDKLAEVKDLFVERKQRDVKYYNDKGKELTKECKDLGEQIEQRKAEIEGIKAEIETKSTEIEKALADFDNLKEPDVESDEKIRELNDELQTLNGQLADAKSKAVDTSGLVAKRSELSCQYDDVCEAIGNAKRNDDIDGKIESLNMKKKELAQQRADCERILNQAAILSMKKNEVLEEQVNKHFDIVKWKLFDVQKNGKTLDACIPFIDGFRFGRSTNTGREFLAKIDILKGLQMFYDQHYPIFVDGAESMSNNTTERINVDSQAIFLKVTEDKGMEVR